MARNARQLKILEIINSRPIDTQEGLAAELSNNGYNATQATVSRDIKELGLVKRLYGGVLRYTYDGMFDNNYSSNISNIYKNAVVNIVTAQNQVVIKTLAGSAQTVAAGIDGQRGLQILGTIAGDDTVLVITPDNAAALSVADRLRDML
ncbi:MAG: arginine repressor [Clostridia bacterium]|nr:arginine repressor [Clostridia bacterium]MBP5593246.1 arginine repressor [Clostridia bacterium]MBP5649348.1 arginine repressor [Clostridia bacterium]